MTIGISSSPENQTPSNPMPRSNVARHPNRYIADLFRGVIDIRKRTQVRTKYKGIVLLSKPIPVDDFKKKVTPEVAAYILKSKSTEDNDLINIEMVDETIVFIPEVSGCLPYPHMTIVEEGLSRLKDEQEGIVDEDYEKLSENAKKKEWGSYSRELKKLHRFPRFYSSQQAANTSFLKSSTARNGVVMVEFLTDAEWGSTGILLGPGA